MSTPVNRTVTIHINQEQAEAKLAKLTKQSATLTKQIKDGQAAGKDMAKQIEELGKKDAQIKQLAGVISGKMAPSIKMVKQHVTQLRNELAHMSEDVPGYAAKFAEFRKASAHLKEMESRVKGVGSVMKSTFSKFMSNVGGVALGTIIGNTVQAGIEKITGYLSGLVTGNAALSDSIADIQKATGMTDSEIEKLNASLGKLDTRTKTKDLREIAVALGQLGVEVTPESIANIDRLVVALGDEFGGDADTITKEVSILRNNLQDIKSGNYGDDVLKIGNALNVLGAEGLATAPVVTDIANRVAGVAQTFGVTSGEILGVAATFQELGIEQERGSTAFIRILQRMTQNVAEYAKIAEFAGVKQEDFADLVNNDIVTALMKVAEGAKIAGGENIAFGAVLKDLEADGSGAGEVLSKMSQNSEMLTGKIKLATTALTETNSVTDEFNKKNTNFAATLEKIEKRLHSAFVNTSLMKGLSNLTTWFGELVGAIDDNHKALSQFTKQRDEMRQLELSTVPLIDRYDELKGRAKLNNEEQAELNRIIAEIAKTMPTAITQFDAYGKAMDISSEKARNWVEQHRRALRAKNREAIQEEKDNIVRLEQLARNFQAELNAVDKDGNIVKSVLEQGHVKVVKRTDEEISRIQQRLQETRGQIEESRALLEELGLDADNQKSTLTINAPAGYNEELERQKNLKKAPKPKATYTSSDDKKKDNEAAERKRKADELLRDFALLQAGLETLRTDGTEKLNAEQEKELLALSNKYKELAVQARQYSTVLLGLSETEQRDLQLTREKHLKERAEHEYTESVKNLEQFHQKEKEQLLQQLNDKQLTQEEYSEHVLQMERDHTLERLQLANDYAEDVKTAETNAQNYRTQALQQGIDERNRAEAKANRDKVAGADLNILLAKKGSKAELNAKKEKLQTEFEIETSHLDKRSNEFLLKEKQLHDQLKTLDKDYLKTKLQGYIDMAAQIVDAIGSIIAVQQQASELALQKEVNRIDKELDRYQQLLDEKRISQELFNSKTAALEEEKRKKEQDHARKAFEQQKALAMGQILINTANSIMRAWSDLGPIGAAIATAAIVGISGYQASVVAGQEFPEYARGGKLEGPAHSGGGIHMIDSRTNRKVGEVEGGEVILSKETARNNPQIVDALLYNSMHRGGATLPDWMYSRPAPMPKTIPLPVPGSRQHMQNGGVVSAGSSYSTNMYQNDAGMNSDDIRTFAKAVQAFVEQTKKGINANVYANELEKKNAELTKIRNRGRMTG